MTQQEMCEKLLPSIQKSPIYTKSGKYEYRVPGEWLKTYVDGNFETQNFLPCTTHMVIRGIKGEQFAIPVSSFMERYEIIEPSSDLGAWGECLAKGKIKVALVTSENFVHSFIAAWGEQMNVTLGGFYACPVGGNEVYFIDKEVFYATYSV